MSLSTHTLVVNNGEILHPLVASCGPNRERPMMPVIFLLIVSQNGCSGGIASRYVMHWLVSGVVPSGSKMCAGPQT
jgi:hypothetical protein